MRRGAPRAANARGAARSTSLDGDTSSRRGAQSEKCIAGLFFRGSALSTPLLSSVVPAFSHPRTKASICNAWKPRGSQSEERSSAPEPFLASVGSDVARLAVCRRRRIAQSRARTGVSPEKERSRSRLRSSRSGYRYRLVALPVAAPRSHAPRSPGGASSHAPPLLTTATAPPLASRGSGVERASDSPAPASSAQPSGSCAESNRPKTKLPGASHSTQL
jgi:hypothetical protein